MNPKKSTQYRSILGSPIWHTAYYRYKAARAFSLLGEVVQFRRKNFDRFQFYFKLICRGALSPEDAFSIVTGSISNYPEKFEKWCHIQAMLSEGFISVNDLTSVLTWQDGEPEIVTANTTLFESVEQDSKCYALPQS